jgi:hypothetical protein
MTDLTMSTLTDLTSLTVAGGKIGIYWIRRCYW